MAKNIKKIPFPDWLLNIDCTIELYDSSITEDGESMSIGIIEDKCIFSEKSKRIVDKEGTRVDLIGKIIIKGDIAPSLPKIKTGKVFIANKELNIYSCSRPRNPDGTIYSTNLEVM